MRYDIMKTAFFDELQKIAVSGHAAELSHAFFTSKKGLALMSGVGGAVGAANAAALSKKERTKKNGEVVSRPKAALMGGGVGALATPVISRVLEIPTDIKLHKAKRIAKSILEKAKHAGSMQGHVRSGRRPISADTLLQNEKDGSKKTKKKIADLTKLSISPDAAKNLGLLAIGAYGLHRLQKINRRYQTGRQFEMQNNQMW